MVKVAGPSVTPVVGDGFGFCIYTLCNAGVDFGSEGSGGGLLGTIFCLSSVANFVRSASINALAD